MADVNRRRADAPMGIRLVRSGLRGLARISTELAGYAAFRLWFRPGRSGTPDGAGEILREGRSHSIRLGRLRIAAWAWGEGPAVLLLHGWNGRAAQLAFCVPPLLASGFRVVAVDAPAHGRSLGRRTDVWEIAKALEATAGALGPFQAAITHSFGALPLAIALAGERIAVERAVCLAPAAHRDSLLAMFGRQLHLPDPVLAIVARRVDAFAGPGFWERAVITVPTLLLHDADDDRIPLSDAERLVRVWPRATLRVTQGLGHHRILSDPGVVREAVAFLRATRVAEVR